MLRRITLNIHIYGGLLCFSYLIILGISVLNFNHSFAFTMGPGDETTWTQPLAIPSLAKADGKIPAVVGSPKATASLATPSIWRFNEFGLFLTCGVPFDALSFQLVFAVLGVRMSLFASIPNTDWTLVLRAGDVVSTPQKLAMHTLLTIYYPALRAHIVSKWRFPHDRAEDYVQEFLTVKVVGENLISQARMDRGRFRNFIRATLEDFVISRIRHDAAQKRAPARQIPLPSDELIGSEEFDPGNAFDEAWAREVLAEAVAAMKRECSDVSRPDIWALFEARILLPCLDGSDPVPYTDLVERFEFRSPLQAANALTSAKRMFDRNLRLVLSSYADSAQTLEEEIYDLRSILSSK